MEEGKQGRVFHSSMPGALSLVLFLAINIGSHGVDMLPGRFQPEGFWQIFPVCFSYAALWVEFGKWVEASVGSGSEITPSYIHLCLSVRLWIMGMWGLFSVLFVSSYTFSLPSSIVPPVRSRSFPFLFRFTHSCLLSPSANLPALRLPTSSLPSFSFLSCLLFPFVILICFLIFALFWSVFFVLFFLSGDKAPATREAARRHLSARKWSLAWGRKGRKDDTLNSPSLIYAAKYSESLSWKFTYHRDVICVPLWRITNGWSKQQQGQWTRIDNWAYKLCNLNSAFSYIESVTHPTANNQYMESKHRPHKSQ